MAGCSQRLFPGDFQTTLPRPQMSSLVPRLPTLLLAFGALVVGLLAPQRAWAWAPMCDLTASTAIAPMVAPPVESGEIRASELGACPLAVDGEDVRPSLHPASFEDGQVPQPPNQDSAPPDAPRYPLTTPFGWSIAAASLSAVLPRGQVRGEARVGFTRLLERPPCA